MYLQAELCGPRDHNYHPQLRPRRVLRIRCIRAYCSVRRGVPPYRPYHACPICLKSGIRLHCSGSLQKSLCPPLPPSTLLQSTRSAAFCASRHIGHSALSIIGSHHRWGSLSVIMYGRPLNALSVCNLRVNRVLFFLLDTSRALRSSSKIYGLSSRVCLGKCRAGSCLGLTVLYCLSMSPCQDCDMILPTATAPFLCSPL